MPNSDHTPEPTPPADPVDGPAPTTWRSWAIAGAVVAVIAVAAGLFLGGLFLDEIVESLR